MLKKQKRIVITTLNDPSIYPAQHDIAIEFAHAGAEVHFIFQHDVLRNSKLMDPRITYHYSSPVVDSKGGHKRSRVDYKTLLSLFQVIKPDVIIAHHQHIVFALMHKAARFLGRRVSVAGYFSDYHSDHMYVRVLGRFAKYLDAYIDVCDMRVQWRQRAWPRLKSRTFVVRQAPRKRDIAFEDHAGIPRIIFTGSRYVLGLDTERLGAFINALCSYGAEFTWLLPGPSESRERARGLSSHPNYRVLEPVDKEQLLDKLSEFDIGLHWAPMAEAAVDESFFISSASNKIGEYIASSLAVAYTENPGLRYLPPQLSIRFDPTDPIVGAEMLLEAALDRQLLEEKRQSAWTYHKEEMNLEMQVEPLVTTLLK